MVVSPSYEGQTGASAMSETSRLIAAALAALQNSNAPYRPVTPPRDVKSSPKPEVPSAAAPPQARRCRCGSSESCDSASHQQIVKEVQRTLDSEASTLSFLHNLVEHLLKENERLRRECAPPKETGGPQQRDLHMSEARLRASEAIAIESGSDVAKLWAAWKSTESRLRDSERNNLDLSCALDDMRRVGELQTAAVRELTTQCDAKDMTIRNLIESRAGTMIVVSELEQVVGELRAALSVEREKCFLLQVDVDRLCDCDNERKVVLQQRSQTEQMLSALREAHEQVKRQLESKRIRIVELEMLLDGGRKDRQSLQGTGEGRSV